MKAAKTFRFAHAGHTVKTYLAGAELPDDAAQWAIENGYAQIEEEKQPEKKTAAPASAPIKKGRKK